MSEASTLAGLERTPSPQSCDKGWHVIVEGDWDVLNSALPLTLYFNIVRSTLGTRNETLLYLNYDRDILNVERKFVG